MKLRMILSCVAAFATVAVGAPVHAARPGGDDSAITSYTGEKLGVLPGDVQSMATGVSRNGAVVGMSVGGERQRAFYWDPRTRTMHDLTSYGATGYALAIGGGTTEYAVGYEATTTGSGHAVIWIAPPSAPLVLDGAGGIAIGVNDAGTVVGGYRGGAAIWTLIGGTYQRTDIPPLPGSGDSYATDVNNDGIVVGFGHASPDHAVRAFIRLANGNLQPIAPLPGDAECSAQAVSDVVTRSDGRRIVYVVGSSGSFYTGRDATRAVRTTVDADTGTVLESLPLAELWAEGVNGAGDVAGTAATKSGGRAATLWRNGAYFALKPPKGGVGSTSRNMLRSNATVTYVAGETSVNGWPMALRWVIR